MSSTPDKSEWDKTEVCWAHEPPKALSEEKQKQKQKEEWDAGPRVAIFGAGVAGLTAAHELSDRGFRVDVYEESDHVGGLCASQAHYSQRIFPEQNERIRAENPDPTGLKRLPAEHGYRAFYSFYQHLTDTMKRIPLAERPQVELNDNVEWGLYESVYEDDPAAGQVPRTVADNLVACHKVGLGLKKNFRELIYDRRMPRSLQAMGHTLAIWMFGMGYTGRDMARVVMTLMKFLTSCPARRFKEYAGVSLADVVKTEDLSETFKKQFANTTRFLIALDPDKGEARTQLMILSRMLMDGSSFKSGEEQNIDRVLNGPTTERWLKPWQEYLKRQGVRFFFKQKLLRFELDQPADGGIAKVKAAWCECQCRKAADHHPHEANEKLGYERGEKGELRYRCEPDRSVEGSYYKYLISAIPHPALLGVLGPTDSPLLKADAAETTQLEEARKRYAEALASGRVQPPPPGEELPTFRSKGAPPLVDPPLRALENLTQDKNNPVMSGIQFYLSDNVMALPGHIHFPDSKWALSAVFQSQFWGGDFRTRYGHRKVRSILSVDICHFDQEGILGKKAVDCTWDEIAVEVWLQIREALAHWDVPMTRPFKPAGMEITDEEVLAMFQPEELFPKRKVAVKSGPLLNKKGKRVRGDAPIPLPYLDHHIDDLMKFKKKRASEEIFDSGLDATKLPRYFVPGQGSWQHRPGPLPDSFENGEGYRVRLGKLVVIGHFAQTFTSLNTMEAANESARHGVNAILKTEESAAERKKRQHIYERCTIWPLEDDEPPSLQFWKDLDQKLFEQELGHLYDIYGTQSFVEQLFPAKGTVDNDQEKFFNSARTPAELARFQSDFLAFWRRLTSIGLLRQ